MYSSFELSESSFLFFPENSSAPARANPEPMAVPQHRYKKKKLKCFLQTIYQGSDNLSRRSVVGSGGTSLVQCSCRDERLF